MKVEQRDREREREIPNLQYYIEMFDGRFVRFVQKRTRKKKKKTGLEGSPKFDIIFDFSDHDFSNCI